jgi:hypothetical protein
MNYHITFGGFYYKKILIYIFMIKNFENFLVNDPYGEEDWYEDLIVTDNTNIEIGDFLYDWENRYMGKIINVVDNHYLLDNGKTSEKSQLIYHKFKIKKQNENNYYDIDPYGEEIWDDRKTLYNWLIQKHPNRNTWNNIEYLDCSNNQLTSLEGIENLVNLRLLYCSNNQLTILENIENLVNLERLYCRNNQLNSLDGIENLVNLEILSCSNNQLNSLKNIENLVNLRELSCSNNQLTSLEGIENLVNLEYLYCDNNQLNSLEGIENLVNLRELHCYNNQLNSLKGIENLVNLRILYCHNNQLTSLEGIENLVKLEYLSCFNNRFTDNYKKYLKSLKIKNKII